MSLEKSKLSEKKPLKDKLERIPLSKMSSEIIGQAQSKMLEKYPTVRLSKRDLVNWIIEENFGSLSLAIEKVLFERFQDEIKFLEKSIQDLKDQRKKGQEVSLQAVLKDLKPKFRKAEPSSSKKKASKVEAETLSILESGL